MANEVHKIFSRVANALKQWNEEVVFVGGFAIELYKEKVLPVPPRVTNDVDCIIDISNRGKYFLFQEALRELAFVEDSTHGAPICRWKFEDIIIDIMPTDENILGFSNPWYKTGLEQKETFILEDETKIYILPIELYVATKMVAMRNREGGVDLRYNKDLEDIIYLTCMRENLREDLVSDNQELQDFFKREFAWLVSDSVYIKEAIQVLMPTMFGKTFINKILDDFRFLSI